MLKLLRFLFKYARPLWPWYLGGLASLGLTTYITLEIPEKAKSIVNSFTDINQIDQLSSLALLIILLGVIQLFTRALSRILIFWPGRKLEAEIKNDLFSRLIYLPYNFYITHSMGDVISRVANDVNHIRVIVAFGVLQFLNVIFLLMFVLGKMITAHPVLTILCLSPMSLMILVTHFLMPRMHKYSKYNQESLGELTNCITEAYSNVHIIQTNSANESFLEKIRKKNFRVYDSNVKLIIVRTILFPLMTFFTGISKLLILLYGGYEVLQNRFTVGDILAFSIYIGILVFPLTAIGILLSVYQRALTAYDRINDILVEKEEVGDEKIDGDEHIDDEHKPDLNRKEILLSVKNLCFNFEESDHFALKEVSFDIYQGEKIGVWGKIGSGKTTLFHLLTKIYQPPEGTIFWRGRDICNLEVAWYRRQVGYALQTAHIFSNSIENNILFGESNRTFIEAQEAAQKAIISEDIEDLHDTWKTQVGEKGTRLSGGQKQRLSLARTLLRQTPLIILDDILSAVDQSTEKRLAESIFKENRTLIVSSHRPSILKTMDRVFVMKNGRIIAMGTPDEMFQKFGETYGDKGADT